MIRVFLVLAVFLLWGAAVNADTKEPIPDVLYQLRDGQPDRSITPVILRNAVVSLAPGVFNPQAYGAICDGTHRTISATLGVSTISALAAKTSASGATPYAWVTNAIWATKKIALQLAVAETTGATTLYFANALQIPVGATVTGNGIAAATTVSSVSNPATVSSALTGGTISAIGTTSIPLTSATGIVAGSRPTPQTGLSVDDYVVSVSSNTLTMKYGTTGTITNGTSLTFQPPSSVVINNATTANKPISNSATQSTAAVNYWVYFSWPSTDAMIASAEMDWLGTQSAIEAAFAATPSGGKVQLPAGNCVMNNATTPSNAFGWLFFHPNTGSFSPTASVDFIGSGLASTYLSWPNEMGAGTVAMSFGEPYATWDNGLGRYAFGTFIGKMADFSVLGPTGYSSNPVGTIGTWTSGIFAGSRRHMSNLAVHGFYIGMSMEGVDHTAWSNIDVNINAIGLRMGAASTALYANNRIDHLEAYTESLASISLDKNAFWNQIDVSTFACGVTPKCIRYEPGIIDSYSQPTGSEFGNSTFSNVLAEALGQGFIVDDNHGPNVAAVGFGELTMAQMDMRHVALLSSATYLPAGSRFNYWIDCGNCQDNTFQFIPNGIPTVSGQKAAIWMDFANAGFGGTYFEANFTAILANYGSTPFFAWGTIPNIQNQYGIQVCEPRSWCGHAEVYGSGTAPAQGTPLEYIAGTGGADLSVGPAGGSAPFAGINMTTTATNGGTTIVATRLCASTYSAHTIPTSGTATALHWGKLAASGTVTNASSATDGVVIGTIMQVTGSAARMNIGPNGSCD